MSRNSRNFSTSSSSSSGIRIDASSSTSSWTKIGTDMRTASAIASARAAAEALPGDSWLQRLHDGAPAGAIEELLSAVRALVHRIEFERPQSRLGGRRERTGLEPLVEQRRELLAPHGFQAVSPGARPVCVAVLGERFAGPQALGRLER